MAKSVNDQDSKFNIVEDTEYEYNADFLADKISIEIQGVTPQVPKDCSESGDERKDREIDADSLDATSAERSFWMIH